MQGTGYYFQIKLGATCKTGTGTESWIWAELYFFIYSFLRFILVAKGIDFRNLPDARLATLGNLRY